MPKRKKILVFNSGPLFPLIGMNQTRVLNQIKSLSKEHEVDFLFLYTKRDTRKDTILNLNSLCKKVIPLKTVTQSFLFRAAKRLFYNKLMDYLTYPSDYFINSNELTAKAIAKEVIHGGYDVVISHYWQASGFLKLLPDNILKCIDTHYLVEENIDLYNEGKYSHIDTGKISSMLQKELSLQSECFSLADLLIVNSVVQKSILDRNLPIDKSICIPNGQELEHYLNFKKPSEITGVNLLFYGALSNQFNGRALKRILTGILLGVKEQIPEVRLIIMGSNPPEWLRKVTSLDNNILVTGHVDDVRPVFAQCCACLIPLESGSGFRGRVVELLASGVPVIGTRNALDSVQVEHGVTCIIADTDMEIIDWTIRLLRNKALRETISENGKLFVKNNYTIEATFGKLNEYLKSEF